MTAKILYFPGCEMPDGQPAGSGVVITDDDFDTVRAAVEQEVEGAAHALGQCGTETEWIVAVNELVELLLAAALRKAPDG